VIACDGIDWPLLEDKTARCTIVAYWYLRAEKTRDELRVCDAHILPGLRELTQGLENPPVIEVVKIDG
jgi:hypothetical protein